jgi:hypothetical protein
MPALMHYEIQSGPRGQASIIERGEIEQLARASQRDDRRECLEWIVIETRFNVVRASLPAVIKTVRKLRDYLPTEHQDGASSKERRDRVCPVDCLWRLSNCWPPCTVSRPVRPAAVAMDVLCWSQ